MAVIHGTNKSGSKSTGYTLTIINRRAYGLQSKCLENMVPRIFTKGSNSRKERVLISKIVSENIPVPAELLKDVALLKISKIEQRPYKGDVFDFSVDGDENFIGGYGAFCLHNTGDGGALTIQSNDSYRSAKLLRWYGIDREVSRKDLRCEEDVIRTGSKLHMNDICATIGLEQLKYVEKNLATTRDNAKFYDQALAGLKHVRLLRYAGDRRSSYWLYSIRVSDLDGLQDYLAARGIMASKVHVRNDLHTAFRPFRCNLPGVDEFSREQISIPVGWWVTPEDRARIAQAVVEWDRAQ